MWWTLLLPAALATTPPSSPPDLVAEAAAAERALAYDRAVALCVQAASVDPPPPRLDRCRRRVAFLEARRDADGSFTGWTALERARAAFKDVGPEGTRADVAALVVREGLASAVRAEAAIWLARDDLDRRGDPAAALAGTDALYVDRARLDPDQLRLLVDARSRALARLGRAAEAHTVEAEVKIATASPRPTPVDQELHRQRDAAWTTAAWVTLAAFALLTAPSLPKGLAARPRPWGLVPLWLAISGAWLVADGWEEGAGRALPWMGLGFTAIHLLGALARRPDAGTAWRVVVGAGATAATLAVAWLALSTTRTAAWVGL